MEYEDESNVEKAKDAKINAMALMMVAKYHAYQLFEANRQMFKEVTKYAKFNENTVRLMDFGEGLTDIQRAASGYPHVLMGHQKLSAAIEAKDDGATPEEISQAYQRAVEVYGLPREDKALRKILFR